MSNEENQHADYEDNQQKTEEQIQIERIAAFIQQYYAPATLETYEDVIDIEQFYELFEHLEEDQRPLMWQIEEAMQLAGFKNEEARFELYFFVAIPQTQEDEENTDTSSQNDEDTPYSETGSGDISGDTGDGQNRNTFL